MIRAFVSQISDQLPVILILIKIIQNCPSLRLGKSVILTNFHFSLIDFLRQD